VNLTDLERKRLNKLRKIADQYYEDYNAHMANGVRLARISSKLFGPQGDFERFWRPIRERESK
jgi:hypothetical protein